MTALMTSFNNAYMYVSLIQTTDPTLSARIFIDYHQSTCRRFCEYFAFCGRKNNKPQCPDELYFTGSCISEPFPLEIALPLEPWISRYINKELQQRRMVL